MYFKNKKILLWTTILSEFAFCKETGCVQHIFRELPRNLELFEECQRKISEAEKITWSS